MSDSVLREKVVIVTGASSGIGRALALQLAEEGAWLALAARNVDQLETVAADCRRYSGRAIVVPTDVAEQAQCQNLVEQTVAEFGRLDILINNAGISMWIIIQATARRKREEVMTLRGKLSLWMKLIAPGAVDRVARRAIEEGK